jgi:hypothetical protein
MTRILPPADATAAREIGIDAPKSFGWRVFHERHPALVDQVLAATPYPPQIRQRLRGLVDASRSGAIPSLDADAPDVEAWRQWGAHWLGRSWSSAPFLWAESYFYRLLLDIVGHPTSRVWGQLDPFAPMKAAELRDPTLDDALRRPTSSATCPHEDRSRPCCTPACGATAPISASASTTASPTYRRARPSWPTTPSRWSPR